jgi:hypothetical protein
VDPIFELLLLPDVVLIHHELLLGVPAPPPPLTRRGRGVSAVGEVIQVEPIRGVGAVHIIVPVTDSELLVEAGVVAAHVGDPATILVTHVEDHAVELQVSVEADGAVGAVEGEGDVGHVRPAPLLQG